VRSAAVGIKKKDIAMYAKQKNQWNRKPKATKILPEIWRFYNIPTPIPEYQFLIERRFKIDYAWPLPLVAMEIEGGIWTNGRHIQPKGFQTDMYKYNKLAELGWLLLRYEPKKIDYEQIRKTIYSKLKK
jgi:hypothetical protein